jgi:hypothetical protein
LVNHLELEFEAVLNKNKIIFVLIILIIATLTGIVLIFDLGVIKWFTCSSPFANPQDKTSKICGKLESVP